MRYILREKIVSLIRNFRNMRSFKESIRRSPLHKIYLSLVSVPLLGYGYVWYFLSGKTPRRSLAALIFLYDLTNGKSRDWLSSLIRKYQGKYQIKTAEGCLGKLNEFDLQGITAEIRENGYFIFNKFLPFDICDRITEFALKTPAKLIPARNDIDEKIVYNREKPVTTKYEFATEDIVKCPELQTLITDESLLAVANEYFQSKPFQDMVSMWWSSSLNCNADSEVAQMYHYDMDRIKFLKFFFYLTDVDTKTGPHCFIKTSHRKRPKPLRYYGRISDEEVFQHYDKEMEVEITGKKGTIMVVDTSGLHKGKTLVEKDRLIFQIEYSNSFFGLFYQDQNIQESDENSALFSKIPQAFRETFERFKKR